MSRLSACMKHHSRPESRQDVMSRVGQLISHTKRLQSFMVMNSSSSPHGQTSNVI